MSRLFALDRFEAAFAWLPPVNTGGWMSLVDQVPCVDLRSAATEGALDRADFLATLRCLSNLSAGDSVHLPADVNALKRLERSGAIAAAVCNGASLLIEGRPIDASEVPGGEPQLPLPMPGGDDSCRWFADLGQRWRRPPPLDRHGRRYYWIDGLKAARSLAADRRDRFDTDADLVFFELVDNVHRWATSASNRANRAKAIASVSATRGGRRSFDRLHFVVVDSGQGILGSLREKNRKRFDTETPPSCLLGNDGVTAADVLRHLCEKGYRQREIASAKGGNGLHKLNEAFVRWGGSIDIVTAIGAGRVSSIHRSGADGAWQHLEDYQSDVRGTLVHLTLEVRPEL